MASWTLQGVAAVAIAATALPAAAQQAPARTTVELADGWRFRQDDNIKGGEAIDYSDADWTQVSVPHSWNRVGVYLPGNPARQTTEAQVNKTMGVGWYRLGFTPPASMRGKRVWVEFDAASRIANVWLNGVLLGEHKGGYSRFRLDATAALRPDGRNVLVVRTDNSKPEVGSSTADVLPLFGDFFVPGGLYRPVRLVATDPVHIDMRDSGGPGIYATTRAIAGGAATVDTVAKLRNDATRPATVNVRTRLLDADGKVAASSEKRITLRPASAQDVTATLPVTQARLWHGVDDPYLYNLSVEIAAADGRVLDTVSQPFGIRTMRVDPERGFFLNDKPYQLRGVGYHQDRADKGWAIDEADVEADVKLLRKMGVTSLRLTHYQHGQPIHTLADRYGLVLWAEIPLVTAWTLGGAKDPTPGLVANARQQLTELVRQNQNRASVAVWGIANEVDFGNSQPRFTGASGVTPDPMTLLATMQNLAKELDPSRPTTLATCCEGRLFAEGIEVPITASAADLGGTNRYYGWYYGEVDDVGPALDALRAKRPNQPLSITEYGAGGALTMHTDNVLGGPVDSRGRGQPEEYESWIHERNWTALAARPYLWGSWLWAGFDFGSTIRREGDADDINTKGLIAYDHKTTKDAYYFYKANWTQTPTVRVNGRRYVDRAYRVTDVRVYSNAPATELLLNGKSLGTARDCPMRVCVFKDVSLSPGENRVTARGQFTEGPVEDAVTWQLGQAATAAFRIDAGALLAPRSERSKFGSDNFFVGGIAGTVDKPANYGQPKVDTPITGTPDRGLAATYREGEFSYRIPTGSGSFNALLTFVEPSAAAGERTFDVFANGRKLISDLDVAKVAGGSLKAVQRRVKVKAVDGMVELKFASTRGKAIVSMIEIER